MKKWIAALVLGAALVACVGCGGDNPSIGGTYRGTISGTQAGRSFSDSVTFTLSQSGSAVSGTFFLASGFSGTVSGSVSGTSFPFTVQQTNPCAGSFPGSGTVSGSSLSGSYSGSSPCTGSVTAQFSVQK